MLGSINDNGSNEVTFEDWIETVQGDQVAPVFANLFGSGASALPETPEQQTQSIAETVRRVATDVAAATVREMAAPAAATYTPNPALARQPPPTPVLSSSLAELRASAELVSGGGTGTDSTPKKKGDKEMSSHEWLHKAALAREAENKLALKKKVTVTQKMLARLTDTRVAHFLHAGLGKFTWSQIGLEILVAYLSWPSLKPELRRLLQVMHHRLVQMRDTFVTTVASHIVGVAVVPALAMIAHAGGQDDDSESGAATAAASVAHLAVNSSLSPISEGSEQYPDSPSTVSMRDASTISIRDSDVEQDYGEVESRIKQIEATHAAFEMRRTNFTIRVTVPEALGSGGSWASSNKTIEESDTEVPNALSDGELEALDRLRAAVKCQARRRRRPFATWSTWRSSNGEVDGGRRCSSARDARRDGGGALAGRSSGALAGRFHCC